MNNYFNKKEFVGYPEVIYPSPYNVVKLPNTSVYNRPIQEYTVYSIATNRDPIHIQEIITPYGNLQSKLGTNLGTNRN
jgi:hypothetical protein